jgi:hypothetical protein
MTESIEKDEFQKKAFELWMAVTMFISTYSKESNGIVRNVSEMLPYASDLQNFWSAYQKASSNDLIRKLHTKVRSRVKLMKDKLDESIRLCGDDQKLLDKYSENQGYIERKLNELHDMIPREPRRVAEPEQMTLDFDAVPSSSSSEEPSSSDADNLTAKSEKFLKRLNELRVSVNGFLSSYAEADKANSVVSYIADMDESIKVLDNLWRRYVREQWNEPVIDEINASMKRCIASLKSQCEMSMLVRDSNKCHEQYAQNHDYVVKKLDALVRAFPNGTH